MFGTRGLARYAATEACRQAAQTSVGMCYNCDRVSQTHLQHDPRTFRTLFNVLELDTQRHHTRNTFADRHATCVRTRGECRMYRVEVARPQTRSKQRPDAITSERLWGRALIASFHMHSVPMAADGANVRKFDARSTESTQGPTRVSFDLCAHPNRLVRSTFINFTSAI